MASQNMELKRILGFTTNGRNSFISQANTGNIIYIAGCVVVVYNTKLKTQNHLFTNSKQNITTLAISDDGRFLAAADCGTAEATVYVWNLTKMSLEMEFSAHQIEVSCMSFSADGQMLVSVGSQHDMMLSVWNWRKQLRLASHEISTKIRAISFSADGSYFITVGQAYVKYWYIKPTTGNLSDSIDNSTAAISISIRSATLGEQRENNFCDVKCGRGLMSDSTFCVTKSGLLCELNNKRLLHKWVDLRTSSANCLGVSDNIIVVGCANGVARCFNTYELRFLKNLPRPHTLGLDISTNSRKQQQPSDRSVPQMSGSINYPNIISIGLDENDNTISCVYNDRSIYVWDLSDSDRVVKKYSALYHSSCIWGIDMYPVSATNLLLPPGSFITCSGDDTLRIWDPKVFNSKLTSRSSNTIHNSIYKDSLFSDESLKIIFTDATHKFLCDLDCFELDKIDHQNIYDSNKGLRCLKISPDGQQLTVGSRSGAIRIFDFELDREIKNIAAHDAEVLCLEYSDPKKFAGFCYLASSSRDKLIHIFDASNNYNFLQTIDDHSSSITALRFVNNRARDCLQLISCGADQKIIFRNGIEVSGGQLNFVSDQYIEGKNTFYDMEVDSESSCLMTACQDRMIRLFNVAQVKYQSGFKGSSSDEGTLIKIELDPSCTFLAASSTDKSISIYDYQRGECIAYVTHGLSDLITDMKFSHDGRYLIACSGDGCIFIWTSPGEIVNAIGGNLGVGQQISLSPRSLAGPVSQQAEDCRSNISRNALLDKGLSESGDLAAAAVKLKSLPDWARVQLLDELDRNQHGKRAGGNDGQLDRRSSSNDTLYEDAATQAEELSGKVTKNQSNRYQVVQSSEAAKILPSGRDDVDYLNTIDHNRLYTRSDNDDDYGTTKDSSVTSPLGNPMHTSYNDSSNDDTENQSSQHSNISQHQRPSESLDKNRHYISRVSRSSNAGLVSNMAKFFQSRENLDKISSREKFVKESLVHKSGDTKRGVGEAGGGQPKSNPSLTGQFNTKLTILDQRSTSTNQGVQAEKDFVSNTGQHLIDKESINSPADSQTRQSSDVDSAVGSTILIAQNNHGHSMQPNQLRTNYSFGLSQSPHVLNNTLRQDSSDDELSSADDHGQTNISSSSSSTKRSNHRPTTPPKLSLHRQNRRNSANQSVARSSNIKPDSEGSNYNHNSSGRYMSNTSNRSRSTGRKIYNDLPSTATASSTIRTSKSQCNLDSYPMDDHQQLNSTLTVGRTAKMAGGSGEDGLSISNNLPVIYCEKLDFAKLNPATVPMTKELCHYVVEELQALSKYATRLHQRLQSSGNLGLSAIVARGVQNSMDILSIVPPRALHHHQFQSQVSMSPVSLMSRRRAQSQQRRPTGASSALGTNSTTTNSIKNQRAPVYLSQPRAKAVATSIRSVGSPASGNDDKPKSSDYRTSRRDGNSKISNSEAMPSMASHQLKVSGEKSKSSPLNIDQVLEAYSDRLFKMVQERIIEQSGGQSSADTTQK